MRRGLEAGRPLFLIETGEEERALALLARVTTPALPLRHWTCLAGLQGEDGCTRDPAQALQAVVSRPSATRFVFSDLDPFLDRPEVQRGLRDAGRALAAEGGACLLLSPRAALPLALQADVAVVRLGLPDAAELREVVDLALAQAGPGVARDERGAAELAAALGGLPLAEARYVLRGALQVRGDASRERTLELLFREKARALGAGGLLELIPPRHGLDGLGGLGSLKAWLDERRDLLLPAALAAGHPIPRGILVTGVSGCGKSAAVKATSAAWGVPLFRLDLTRVFSGSYGVPEAAFQRALDTLEAAAPVVVWIDEIEDALGSVSRGGRFTHLFSSLLTWLQERPPLVFVAATANRIHELPAELLRKGRFDEVFFVDLPTPGERLEILRVHLRREGVEPEGFPLEHLVADTRGWTGAELEEAVRLCKRSDEPTPSERGFLKQSKLGAALERIHHPVGCDHCQQIGYRGRTGIHELLTVTPRIRQQISDAGRQEALKEIARSDGMRTLFEDGAEKVKLGITSLDEVFRVSLPDEVA